MLLTIIHLSFVFTKRKTELYICMWVLHNLSAFKKCCLIIHYILPPPPSTIQLPHTIFHTPINPFTPLSSMQFCCHTFYYSCFIHSYNMTILPKHSSILSHPVSFPDCKSFVPFTLFFVHSLPYQSFLYYKHISSQNIYSYSSH